MRIPWQGRSFAETTQTRTAMLKPLDSDTRKTFSQFSSHQNSPPICKIYFPYYMQLQRFVFQATDK